ncbi:hypothetical protein ACAF76_014765 [Brevibacillus sp. TJ4]|uniref:hypothetical protein n=1 Tax=Brevibacillus sp. TJ4 TaxID=3234853 RepID=UPI003BA0090F
MNGEKRNNVTLKMNGRFFDQAEKQPEKQQLEQPAQENSTGKPRVRIQGPTLAEIENMPKREDAWDRMQQLRNQQEQMPPAAPAPQQHPLEFEGQNEEREELSKSHQGVAAFSDYVRSFPRGPVVRTLLSTVGAIAIGLVFGFMVLSVFSEEQFTSSYRSVLNSTVETLTAPTASLSGEKQGGDSAPQTEDGSTQSLAAGANPVAVPLQLDAVTMFVAQAGVFQPDASAQAATEPLTQLGLPHLLYSDGERQYMFAAAAPNRDAVLGFASNIKNKGIDVYVKEFQFPSYHGQVTVGKAEGATEEPDLAQFFSTGLQLANLLSSQSGMVVSANQAAFTPEQASEIKELHRQFLEESRLMQVPAAWETYVQGMVNGINQAVAAREKMAESSAGNRQSAESYAWQVQAGVLGYLEQYAKWVQQLGKHA